MCILLFHNQKLRSNKLYIDELYINVHILCSVYNYFTCFIDYVFPFPISGGAGPAVLFVCFPNPENPEPKRPMK